MPSSEQASPLHCIRRKGRMREERQRRSERVCLLQQGGTLQQRRTLVI